MSTSSTERPAGWYPHPRDPPGTRREWDGSKWVGEAVMSPEPIEQDDKHRTRLAGSLALHFVDPPQVIQTSAGLKVKITVLNGGPVDALFAFDLRVDGGIVQVTNPQAVIQTGGPVRLDLSVPLDSSITTNTKLTVSASTKGGQLVTISSASVTSGGIFSGSVGAVLAAGVISLGGFVGWQTIRSDEESTAVATEAGSDQREDGLASPTTDDSTDDAATQSTEDDDNTIEPTQPAVEEDSLAASYGGSYVLPLIDISTDRLTTDDARLALRLDLLDDADCDPCRYVLVYQGQELGEVTLSDNTATTVLDAALDDGPLVATCEASDGSEAGTYRQPGPSTAKIAVATSGAALDVDASVTQTFELIGGDPGSGCRSPWKLDTSYALDGTSDFSITKERPQVIQPKGFVKLDTSVVECGLGEQTCDRQLVLSVLDAGDGNEPAITLTAGSGHCAPIVYTVLVGGSVAGSTDELNAGQTSTLKLGSLSTDPESPSEVSIHATGVEGGCNTGELLSWAVTAELAGAVALARAPAVSNLG